MRKTDKTKVRIVPVIAATQEHSATMQEVTNARKI